MKLFINGVEVGHRDFRGKRSLYKSNLPLRIGWTHEIHGTAQSPFIGQIDEVRIWNIARTEADIYSDMITQLKGDEPGLVGYWNFDDETDGIISDMSPNSNDGRLVGTSKLINYIRPISVLTGAEKLARAAIAYEKLLVEETNSYEAFRYLAEIHIKTERFSDAEKVYLRALEVDLTQSERNHAIRAIWNLYNAKDAEEEFISLLEKLKTKMEGSSVLYELLGDAYKKAGEKEKAELAYNRWVQIRKRDIENNKLTSKYHNFAEELLRKNLFPETALELAETASGRSSNSKYKITLAHAYLLNEMYTEAYQIIDSFLNASFYEYTERSMFSRIVKAGKNVKDKDGYVEMLNNLIDTLLFDLPAQLNATLALAQFYRANNLHDNAETLIQETGFITEEAWLILGPFDNIGEIGFNTKFIPENLPQIDTGRKYDGKKGRVGWRKCEDEILNGYISLGNNIDWTVSYAYATVNSPDERQVEFRFDSDDQGKVWINGIQVHSHTRTYAADIDREIIPVTLYPGQNSILIKVCEESGGSGFYVRITDENGNAFDDLEISTTKEN